MITTLFEGAAAANLAPASVTAGRPIWKGYTPPATAAGAASGYLHPGEGLSRDVDEAMILIENTSGSGSLSIEYIRLWGLAYPALDPGTGVLPAAKWFPIGPGAVGDKGKLNYHVVADVATFTIESYASGLLAHAERVRGFGEFEKLYPEIGVVTGSFNLRITLQAYASRAPR